MNIIHYTDIEPKPVDMEGATGVTIRYLISTNEGAENFVMRLFEIQPGGQTPLHKHAWEHEVYILQGEGSIWKEGTDMPLASETAVFVPGNERHCFKNTSKCILQFLCLVPIIH